MECGKPVIMVASKAGFCFGVKRAVKIAFDAVKSFSNVYTLGPLIHNPQVVERLKAKGIRVAHTLDDIPSGSCVVIRSHGVPFEVYERLKSLDIRIIDATCPFVKKAQEKVHELALSDYRVVVVGDRDHPEVKALVSYGLGKATIYPDIPSNGKIGVVSQTTQHIEDFKQAICRIAENSLFSEMKIFNTVCQSTAERQRECSELAARVDIMIVIGGRNSANTRRLAEIAKKAAKPTYHIEVAEELEPSWFLDKKMIGVTAGASTPDWIINEVVYRIKKMTGGIVEKWKSIG